MLIQIFNHKDLKIMLQIFIINAIINCYVIRVADDNLYISTFYDQFPRISSPEFAVNFTFAGTNIIDGGMALVKDDTLAVTLNENNQYLGFKRFNSKEVPSNQIFFIVIDPGTGFYRIRHGNKCIEWFEGSGYLKATDCLPTATQLFRVVDIGE
ncbi:hypothetical protein TUBRATIS_10380 [Tubulinosema ratisbonensis]|uniref:Uncharacterized protein n=1 Tax=Tubulinosema ratisbonensis TaxID=291195 RepID=A0A437AMR7_9MICR|nr:hypothetical protein TUBRATIS_10380 [Tubulinosema ratisbonensis]